MSARCRSCGQPVIWAQTTHGKRMPLDPQPVDDGNLVVDVDEKDGNVLAVAAVSLPIEMRKVRDMYRSHFTSCPQAGSWRKKHG